VGSFQEAIRANDYGVLVHMVSNVQDWFTQQINSYFDPASQDTSSFAMRIALMFGQTSLLPPAPILLAKVLPQKSLSMTYWFTGVTCLRGTSCVFNISTCFVFSDGATGRKAEYVSPSLCSDPLPDAPAAPGADILSWVRAPSALLDMVSWWAAQQGAYREEFEEPALDAELLFFALFDDPTVSVPEAGIVQLAIPLANVSGACEGERAPPPGSPIAAFSATRIVANASLMLGQIVDTGAYFSYFSLMPKGTDERLILRANQVADKRTRRS
jgi:hypothetical protein